MVNVIFVNPNTIKPKSDLDSNSNNKPLIDLGKQQENQLAKGPFENQPYKGDEVPTILDSKGMRNNYDDL
jgi:hypothetical protein